MLFIRDHIRTGNGLINGLINKTGRPYGFQGGDAFDNAESFAVGVKVTGLPVPPSLENTTIGKGSDIGFCQCRG